MSMRLIRSYPLERCYVRVYPYCGRASRVCDLSYARTFPRCVSNHVAHHGPFATIVYCDGAIVADDSSCLRLQDYAYVGVLANYKSATQLPHREICRRCSESNTVSWTCDRMIVTPSLAAFFSSMYAGSC